jgi:hypothetical protein
VSQGSRGRIAAALSAGPALPLLAGALGLLLYLSTMAPTVLWGDDAELQRIITTGEQRTVGQSSAASHLLWLALATPFVRATGWLPLDAAGRTTLVSALAGAGALAFVALAGRELGRPWLSRAWVAGLLAAVVLGVSHTFWLLAVRPAVYTLSMALLALALWTTLRWRHTGHPAWLVGGAAAAVLALTNHVLALAAGPGLAVLALSVPPDLRRRLGLAAGAALALGAAVLAIAALAGAPLGDLARVVGGYRPSLPPLREVLLAPLYLLYQFPLTWPLGVWGAIALWRADRGALIGLLLLYAGNVLLILLHHPPGVSFRDQFLFFLPSYLPVALLLGVGGAALLDGILRRRWGRAAVLALALAPLLLYPLAARVAGALATRLSPARQLPGRDPVAYYLLPAKGGYAGARAYGEGAMSVLAPGAAVLADWLPYHTLRYLQGVEGRRPDLLLVNINAGTGGQLEFLREQAGKRPLYLADRAPAPYYDLEEIGRCFSLQKEGPLYRLTPKGQVEGGPMCAE